MKSKAVLTVVIPAMMLLAVVAPAVAQVTDKPSDKDYKPPESSTDGDYYDVLENGTILYEGDMGYDCHTLRQHFDKSVYSTQQMVKACTEAGFPPKGALPRTGGLPLVLVPVASLVVSGLLLAHRIDS